MLLGMDPGDFDVATDASPEAVTRLFNRVIPTGIRHGTVTVLYRGIEIEVTTYRSESGYADRRRPDVVQFVGSIGEDLARRDFTINAIAVDCATGTIVDPVGGRADLERRVIRAIGAPEERFREDGLRLIRACRFAAQLQFEVAPDTLAGMRENLDSLVGVSPERIRDELLKTLAAPLPSIGFLVMADSGVLAVVLPELDACRGVEQQKGMHGLDLFAHSIEACDAAPREAAEVRLAALFHDVGKPQAKRIDKDGVVTFHRHEEISAEITRKILGRLKCPTGRIRSVCHLIRHHMFCYRPEWSDAAVRRFVHRVGIEYVRPLFELSRADGAATAGVVSPPGPDLAELAARIDRIRAEEHALSIHDLAVDGNDLSEEAGIPRSREMGVVLRFLLEAVLDDPKLNDRERLIRIARTFYRERMSRP